MTGTSAHERTRELLDATTSDSSFVFIVGDEYGMDLALEAGDHEPTAVHLHLLATHINALADILDTSVADVAQEALTITQQLDEQGAAAITHELNDGDNQS